MLAQIISFLPENSFLKSLLTYAHAVFRLGDRKWEPVELALPYCFCSQQQHGQSMGTATILPLSWEVTEITSTDDILFLFVVVNNFLQGKCLLFLYNFAGFIGDALFLLHASSKLLLQPIISIFCPSITSRGGEREVGVYLEFNIQLVLKPAHTVLHLFWLLLQNTLDNTGNQTFLLSSSPPPLPPSLTLLLFFSLSFFSLLSFFYFFFFSFFPFFLSFSVSNNNKDFEPLSIILTIKQCKGNRGVSQQAEVYEFFSCQ